MKENTATFKETIGTLTNAYSMHSAPNPTAHLPPHSEGWLAEEIETYSNLPLAKQTISQFPKYTNFCGPTA